jgi:cytidine deaminase
MTMINHGTRGGYYAHRRHSEPPCDACREAINEYVREYRAKNGLARNREREKIRRKALAALRDAHRDEYDRLVEQFEADMMEAVL